MMKRWSMAAGAGALALLLANAGISHAQFTTPWYGSVYSGPVYRSAPGLPLSGVASSLAAGPFSYVAYYPPLYTGRGPAPAPAPGSVAGVVAPVSYVTFDPPIYTGRSPAPAPARLLAAGGQATVEVIAPGDAELWFDGHKTSQTGMRRLFATPALPPGQDYHYEVRARWTRGGKSIEQTRRISVHAGARITTAFSTPK